jgi:hypothetical protein
MKNRELKKWALIAEIIGGVAVIVTLVVLVFEVRNNSEVVQSSSFTTISGYLVDHAAMLASDGELTRIYREGNDDMSSLSSEEAGRYNWIMMSITRRIESAYILFQSGNLTDNQFAGFRGICRGVIYQNPWFERQTSVFTSAFVEFVNSECV